MRDRERAAILLAAVTDGARSAASLSRTELRWLAAPLVDRLLERSAELRHEDPEGMIQAAEAARRLAFHLPTRRYGRKVVADLRARTSAELGNALRVADDLHAAADLLAEAAFWARRGTGDLRLAARLGDLAGSLLSDQRRFREAVEVLTRVQRLFEQLGDPHLAGRALISQGIFTEQDGRPEKAVLLFARGLRSLEPERDLSLELTAVQGMVLALLHVGFPETAQRLLEARRPLYERDGKRLNQTRLRWLEGKVAFALGEDARAEAALREAKSCYEKLGKTYDAALASLDLALVLLRQGRRLEIVRLAREMIRTFRALGIEREVVATLILLRQACEEAGTETAEIGARIRTAATVISGLRSRPRKAGR
jgi:tetratricopeptide (TPR) repeat protein